MVEALHAAHQRGPLPEGVTTREPTVPPSREPDDAQMTIRDSAVTIEADIYIYGSGATQAVADEFERQIERDWDRDPATGHPWQHTDLETGNIYGVWFKANVELYDLAHPRSQPGLLARNTA